MIFVDLDGVLGDFDGWARSVMAPGQTHLDLFMTEYERCFADLEVIPKGANLLRALNVAPGKHKVVLTFHPKSVTTTETIAYIAYAAIIIAILIAAFLGYRKKKEQAA